MGEGVDVSRRKRLQLRARLRAAIACGNLPRGVRSMTEYTTTFYGSIVVSDRVLEEMSP